MSDTEINEDFDPNGYWEQRLTEAYTLGSVGWRGLGEAFNRWMYAVRKHVFRRAAGDSVGDPSNLRVLDVGSGTGFYLNAWRELGVRDLSGSDLTSTAVTRLRASFSDIPIHQLDIGADPEKLPSERYDVISIMDVMYHVVDDRRYAQALHNLSRLLKPGGQLIFSENCIMQRKAGIHQVSRSRDEIESALRNAHLVTILQRPMFFLMNSPIDSDSRVLRRWWSTVVRLSARNEMLGWSLGAAVFPVELALVRFASSGPSSKIIICRQEAGSTTSC
jgi:2-polyprenyl-3-methyl-5-hydroxy-6-metoxy-1,4-benzoquinol methylase